MKSIKGIINSENIDELGERAISGIENFSLEKFFKGDNKTGVFNGDSSFKAVGIISADGVFITDSFIDKKSNSTTIDRYPHKDTARVLYRLFTNQSLDRVLLRNDNSEMVWNQKIVNDGLIFLQLSVDDPCEIWLPEKMSKELLDQLGEFNMQVKNVIERNPELSIDFYYKVGTEMSGAQGECVASFDFETGEVIGIDSLINDLEKKLDINKEKHDKIM